MTTPIGIPARPAEEGDPLYVPLGVRDEPQQESGQEDRGRSDHWKDARDGDDAGAHREQRQDGRAGQDALEHDQDGHELEALVRLERSVPRVLERVERDAQSDQVCRQAQLARVPAQFDHGRRHEQCRHGCDHLDGDHVSHERAKGTAPARHLPSEDGVGAEGGERKELPRQGECKGDDAEPGGTELTGNSDEHHEGRALPDDLRDAPDRGVPRDSTRGARCLN